LNRASKGQKVDGQTGGLKTWTDSFSKRNMRMGRFADGEGGYSVEKREHGERVDRELSWVNGIDCAGG